MPYKELKSYQQATIIYDFTVEFCRRFLDRKSRTVDQMEQAARSGKQNIVEGSAASQNSPATELKLIGVARASFEELLEDYRDFLRQRRLKEWGKDEPRALEIRGLVYRTDKTDRPDKTNRTDRPDRTDKTNRTDRPDKTNRLDRSDRTKTDRPDRTDKTNRTSASYETYTTYKSYTSYTSYKSYLNDPEKAANAMIILINQTNFLLDRQTKGVRIQQESRGVNFESQNQRAAKLLYERKQREKEFDDYLKRFLEKKQDE